jgi:hypothetical protein
VASGKLDQALARLNEAAKANPEKRQRPHACSGGPYEKILPVDPRFALAANNLAYLLAQKAPRGSARLLTVGWILPQTPRFGTTGGSAGTARHALALAVNSSVGSPGKDEAKKTLADLK